MFLLALSGVPLTLGFVGRVAVLEAMLEAGGAGGAVVLSVAMALMAWSLLRVAGVLLGSQRAGQGLRTVPDAEGVSVVVVAALVVTGLGLWAAPVVDAARAAAEAF